MCARGIVVGPFIWFQICFCGLNWPDIPSVARVHEGKTMSNVRLLCVLVAVFIFATFTFVSPIPAKSDQEAASSVITAAENAITSAYDAFTEAERVGANVSGLFVRLNDAAELLSEAHMAFEVGDFEEAVRFAELSSEVGREAESEAEWLEVEANNAGVNRSRSSIVRSVLGVSVVIVASLLGYEYFKRRYYRRLLKMRSRVEQA